MNAWRNIKSKPSEKCVCYFLFILFGLLLFIYVLAAKILARMATGKHWGIKRLVINRQYF